MKNKALDAIFCCNFYRYRLVAKLHQKSGTGRILGIPVNRIWYPVDNYYPSIRT